MIAITKINHITQVVPDIDPQLALLQGLFGFTMQSRWEDKAENATIAELEVPGRSGIKWRVLSPKSSDSQYQEFLDSPRGPGVHHVASKLRTSTRPPLNWPLLVLHRQRRARAGSNRA